ncbi:hypothetical protein [Adhaeribacter pallidiroseus]|uniref:hypothetical protein n=1 Tax=Adhaeribacter pallidiroseus TaxID=2072847 RepID=UPI0011C03955|nr:hypothetical protein [Adhaeribacter pallidiroseus]
MNTYGVKILWGVESQLSKLLFNEAYIGLGYRVRSIDRIIYEEGYGSSAWTDTTYPLKKHENNAYFSPQIGVSIGILLAKKTAVRK